MEDDDFRLLEFEDSHPRNNDAKEAALLTEFSLAPSAYFRRLIALIEEPDVISTYPLVRRRLIRIRGRLHQVRAPLIE